MQYTHLWTLLFLQKIIPPSLSVSKTTIVGKCARKTNFFLFISENIVFPEKKISPN